jgi:hypothetical protein
LFRRRIDKEKVGFNRDQSTRFHEDNARREFMKSSLPINLSLYILVSLLAFLVLSREAHSIAVRPVSPIGTKVTGDQWLFVIGIDTYIEWPRLKTAVNDAKAVKQVLLDRYFFGEEHVIEL